MMNARRLGARVAVIGFCIGCVAMQVACIQATRPLPVTTLEAADDAGIFEKGLRFLVLSQSETFAALYSQIASLRLPAPAPPVIDFTTHRALVAFMGQKPTAGYGIHFAAMAQQQGRTIEVQVLRSAPASDALLAQVVTNPYAIAIVAKDRYTEVAFVDESETVLTRVDVPE